MTPPTKQEMDERIARWRSMPVEVVGEPSAAGLAVLQRAFDEFVQYLADHHIDPAELEAECFQAM